MNTQNLETTMLSQTAQQSPRATWECSPYKRYSNKDSFSQSLLLWIASFPLFIAGLSLLGGSWHTIGYLLELAAAVCFFSPVTQLLGCLTERK